MKTILVVVLLWLIGASVMHAQEHEHGMNALPDWYDPSCCNRRDCRPVEDKEIDFISQGGEDWVRHVPTGLLFQKSQWKISQDERYHVCIWDEGVGLEGNFSKRPLCVYIRAGV